MAPAMPSLEALSQALISTLASQVPQLRTSRLGFLPAFDRPQRSPLTSWQGKMQCQKHKPNKLHCQFGLSKLAKWLQVPIKCSTWQCPYPHLPCTSVLIFSGSIGRGAAVADRHDRKDVLLQKRFCKKTECKHLTNHQLTRQSSKAAGEGANWPKCTL